VTRTEGVLRVFDLVPAARAAEAPALRNRLGADFVLVGPTRASALEDGEDQDEEGDWKYLTRIGSREALAMGIGPEMLDHEVHPLRKRTTFFMDTFVIGRAATSDVLIDDPSVSKLHARIRRERDGTLVLSDGGSANGTRHAGKPIPPGKSVPIASGQDIQFGDRVLRLLSTEALHEMLTVLARTPAGGSRRPPPR
jgi:pSer/pThr/pTyr-binding forkhead associated (FHA) protein